MTCGIYLLTYTDGTRYIGQSRNIESRRHPRNKQGYFVSILEECPESALNDREWHWIRELRPERNRHLPIIRGKVKDWTNAAYMDCSECGCRWNQKCQHDRDYWKALDKLEQQLRLDKIA